jgi:AraC-like DNA-binding protein
MTGVAATDWSRYWRSADEPLEAMHARFTGHVYHRHSHDSYSFGVTEWGAQSFTCRHAAHTSAAGMVMAFNPDDPHDGHATTDRGFSYRMIHIGPALVTEVLSDITGRPAGRPLFARPVLQDPGLARALYRLHVALTGPASPLERSERLTAAVATAARFAVRCPPGLAEAGPALTAADRALAGAAPGLRRGEIERTAGLVRDFLDAHYAAQVTGAELAAAAGRSRYAAYRAFRAAWGLAPSEYQRLLRLRAARGFLASGVPPAEAATAAGFADQAHLTRWFRRCYGITPAEFRRAAP